MRPDLMALLGHRVTVTNPHIGSSWTGKLAAVGNEPCVVIDQDHGPRLCLPQSFTVTPADDTPPTPKSSARWDRLAIMEADGEVTYTWPDVPPTADLVAGARVHGLLDRQLDRLAETLFNSIDRLEQHIDERAQELAKPAIAQARAEVAEAQEERDHWRTRFTDLQGEHQRQHKVVERRAVRAETAIARTLATLALNTQLQADNPSYQACADHVRAALNGATDQTEGTPA